MAKRHFGEALKHDPDFTAARNEFNKVGWDGAVHVRVVRACVPVCAYAVMCKRGEYVGDGCN